MKQGAKSIAYFGMFIVTSLLFFGLYRAFTRGASDFNVFYGAWQLVLQSKSDQIYRVSADRYLYSPAFAWILSPFALLTYPKALMVWCGLKILTLVGMIRKFQAHLDPSRSLAGFAILSISILIVARPILIDLEYGQVNLFILGACFWAIVGHFDRKNSHFWDGLRWGCIAFVAIAKLFPLPLLLIPFFVTEGVSKKKLRAERFGIVLSTIVTLLIPIFAVGWSSGILLYSDWQKALIDRGFPTESHNQSFTAFLYRYLSGGPTWVRSEGMHPLYLGIKWLSQDQIRLFSVAWLLIFMGVLCGLIVSGPKKKYLPWASLLIGLSIVPSHLVWKPYFVMSLPLAILILWSYVSSKNKIDLYLSLLVFAGMNLSGFDFVGHTRAAYLESASLLLWIHLLMLVRVGWMTLK